MRSKLGRLGVLGVVVAGLLGSGMTPAHAATSGTAMFQGTMVTGPIGSPCAPVGTTINCPPPIDKWGQPTVGFFFASTTCIGEKVDALKEIKPGTTAGAGVYGPLCQIRAAGAITGYCGLMLGTLQMTITWFPTDTKTVNATVTFKDVGGTAFVNGISEKGIITGIWEFTPDPTRGSCFTGTNTGFIVTGSLTLTGTNIP